MGILDHRPRYFGLLAMKRERFGAVEASAVFNDLEIQPSRRYGKRLPAAGDITRHRASEASMAALMSSPTGAASQGARGATL